MAVLSHPETLDKLSAATQSNVCFGKAAVQQRYWPDRRLWAGRHGTHGPAASYKSIHSRAVQVDAEILDCAVHIRVTEQKRDGEQDELGEEFGPPRPKIEAISFWQYLPSDDLVRLRLHNFRSRSGSASRYALRKSQIFIRFEELLEHFEPDRDERYQRCSVDDIVVVTEQRSTVRSSFSVREGRMIEDRLKLCSCARE
ncbi:hypothetical protein [Falsirhodobacter sp. 1013]|uniref:hypothetical protein n=1 Tax=Falsirhodobacter sp. 1013 TaxID=3417566 RepID=UPI003EBF2B2B